MFIFRTVLWGTVFLIAALIFGPWLALQFDTSFPPLAISWLYYIGVAFCLIGASLAIYCALLVLTPGTSRPAPYDAGGSFTIAGPYLFMRNPFMLGVLLTLWGEAFILMRIVMIAYAFIFTWVIYFWVIFFEEPALIEGLGEDYLKYKKTVPRWFPQFRKYKG